MVTTISNKIGRKNPSKLSATVLVRKKLFRQRLDNKLRTKLSATVPRTLSWTPTSVDLDTRTACTTGKRFGSMILPLASPPSSTNESPQQARWTPQDPLINVQWAMSSEVGVRSVGYGIQPFILRLRENGQCVAPMTNILSSSTLTVINYWPIH